MRKFKFFSVILAFMVFLGSFTGCNPTTSSQDPAPVHTCESVCETCGKCMDTECTETACADKCTGHEITPEHTCESVCETCGKCKDADCSETVCADKCAGHTVAPTHTCESVCETCGKCKDADCSETVCADKCTGHTTTPGHTCESVCETCGKCKDTVCTETVCADKCTGHTQAPTHTCESVCETCGGCKDAACTEEICENKCPGHTVAPEHTCESVCEKCGMCKDAACTEAACKYKCPGHVVGTEWDMFDLKFMSFNLKIPGTAPDGHSWTARSPKIIEWINNSGAHVIGLQECSATPKGDIEAGLNKDKYTFLYFGDDASNLAMIYDHTVFTLIRTEKYWMSDTPDVKSNGWDAGNFRAACILYLQHKATGEMVKAINTHGPLSDEGNVKGFDLIAERSLSSDTPMMTIMTGDFNAGVNKLGYVPIAKQLQDCRFAAYESTTRDHNTFHNWGQNTTSIIDFCFVTKSEDVEVLNYEVHTDTGSSSLSWLSDHYPIYSTVRVYNPNNSWTGFY